jgi:hypothetical protein
VSLNGLSAGMLLLALLGAAGGCARRPSESQQQAWDRELHRLTVEQDSLRARASALVQADPRMQKLPAGDVVMVVPTVFLRSVIEQVFEDVVGNVTLSVHGLKSHVAKSVHQVIPIGDYVLDVDVHELSGVLSPGRPVLGFGGDRTSMLLPVKVREGRGEATFHFVWKSKSLPDLTCGDWDITQKVSGTVVPSEFLLSGGMSLRTRGNRIVCTPEFPETKLRLRVTPSPASRDAVRSLLAQKRGLCGWVIERVDLPGLLSAMLEAQGFDVAIPMNRIPALDLPAGVRESVRVGGRVLVVEARTRTLRLDAEAIWYSADVTMRPR